MPRRTRREWRVVPSPLSLERILSRFSLLPLGPMWSFDCRRP